MELTFVRSTIEAAKSLCLNRGNGLDGWTILLSTVGGLANIQAS